MKGKYILLLCGLFSFSTLCALNQIDKKGRKQGEWKKTYENGQVMYEGNFVNNQPTGVFKRYYESGALKSVQTYETPERSQIVVYEEDGKTISVKGTYLNKKKEAEWTYYVKGKISLLEVYNDGRKNGTSKVYIKEGALIEEIPYVRDTIDGMRKRFLQDGKRYSEVSYKKGVEHGSYKLYEGHDFPVIEGVYKNGKRDGDWILKDDKGVQTDVMKYKDGVLLNAKELKKENSDTFDQNEQNKGKYKEPGEENM